MNLGVKNVVPDCIVETGLYDYSRLNKYFFSFNEFDKSIQIKGRNKKHLLKWNESFWFIDFRIKFIGINDHVSNLNFHNIEN